MVSGGGGCGFGGDWGGALVSSTKKVMVSFGFEVGF